MEPIARHFRDDGDIPNNRLPLLYYPGAIDPNHVDAALIESLFAQNDWPDSWRNGVFSYPHYHSDAHEVLGCYSGHADVRLGGVNGTLQRVEAGDVVVLPAGVGHQKLGGSADFAVVGSYPRGQTPDTQRGGSRPAGVSTAIAAVPLPSADPVFGNDGPLTSHWK
ncbi:MAG: cupin domain-containing protein [Limisphaerales bacterium]